ncbi:MAG: putative HAD superfamily phosphohydrolase YqeG [Pseudohongiellaceae bacterium]|jgi:predicted HAD superfamily phosphohydrolase YqeG
MADWTTTVRQSLPKLVQVLRHMRPTFHVAGIADISPDFVRESGFELMLWDIDGTLGPWHCQALDLEQAQAWAALTQMPKVRHVILSNCGDSRWQELGRLFPEVPVLRGFQGPRAVVARQHLGGIESWVGDAGLSASTSSLQAVRKPSAELVQVALRAGGCDRPEAAVMIGDQYLTDVAGAGMAGVRSIKVMTIGRRSFPLAVRVLQRIEELLYRLFHGRYSRSNPPRRTGPND